MHHLFTNLAAATQAGYTRRTIVVYRGFSITTGRSKHPLNNGLHYVMTASRHPLRAAFDRATKRAPFDASRVFARSVTVYFSEERNHSGTLGAVDLMFRPGEAAAGIARAKRAIDLWHAEQSQTAEVSGAGNI